MATKEPITVVKKVKNGALLSNGLIRMEKVRLSFPHLEKAYKGKNDGDDKKPAFGVTSMLHKTDDNPLNTDHVELKGLIVEVMNKMMEENEVKKLASDRKFIRNGDDSSRVEYEGYWTVSARELKRPVVKNKKGETIAVEDEEDRDAIKEMFFSGCYATVLIRPWYQDGVKVGAGFGERLNAGLVAVQFFSDKGERLSGDGISEDDVNESMGGMDDDEAGGGFDDDDDDDL